MDAIQALEKRIEQGAEDIIRLKRTRNSLLNISTLVPPEILGHIFCWNVIPEGDFGGLRKGSYRFLLVCHHWFDVASKTPELWYFWGNTLCQWSRRHQRSQVTAPLDLVLTSCHDDACDTDHTLLDGPIRDALQDRLASDSIRSFRLEGWNITPLHSVISSLTPNGEEIRHSSIESLILDTNGLDVSGFLARYHFPKLRHLYLLVGLDSWAWDHLMSHTTSLTFLSLMNGSSTTPTTSQLLSILASNPLLQTLRLSSSMVPCDSGDGSQFLVPLRHLKDLLLAGGFHSVLRLLHRLDHPVSMDKITLNLSDCPTREIPGTLGPYLRDYILRDVRFQNRLGIFINASLCSFVIGAMIVDDAHCITPPPGKIPLSLELQLILRDALTPETLADEYELFTDFAAHIPVEHVVLIESNIPPNAAEEIVATMPKIQELCLFRVPLSDKFLQPDPWGPFADTKLLPSLRYLHLEDMEENDWRPLVPYLVHQTSGGQAGFSPDHWDVHSYLSACDEGDKGLG
jgi:hypothetical protein